MVEMMIKQALRRDTEKRQMTMTVKFPQITSRLVPPATRHQCAELRLVPIFPITLLSDRLAALRPRIIARPPPPTRKNRGKSLCNVCPNLNINEPAVNSNRHRRPPVSVQTAH